MVSNVLFVVACLLLASYSVIRFTQGAVKRKVFVRRWYADRQVNPMVFFPMMATYFLMALISILFAVATVFFY